MQKLWWAFACAVPMALGAACGSSGDQPGEAASASGSVAVPLPPLAPASLKPITLTGGALAAGADDRTLIVADEDHEVLFVVPHGLDSADGVQVLPMPGPPAQVVDAGDAVFVTIRSLPTPEAAQARSAIKGPTPTRDAMTATVMKAPTAPAASAKPSAAAVASAAPKPPPKKERGTRPLMFDPMLVNKSSGGLLLVLKRDAQGNLTESGRLLLPVDAWGLSLTPDTKRALVTSAWTAKLSIVDVGDWAKPALVATLDAAREPRGVAIKADGKTAYISHLVGSALTRIDGLDGTPKASSVELPVAISRTPIGARVEASLGYGLVISPDQKTLFAPRHALGADGIASWWGALS